MDKLIHQGDKATVTNDGATIIKLLDIVHPAAKALADVAVAQDNEVGDGTTSVMVLAGEFLREAKGFIEDGMHPRIIIKGCRDASSIAIRKIKDIEHKVNNHQSPEFRELLVKCAKTSLNSKLVSSYKEFFAEIVVDAVMKLDADLEKDMIGIKHVQGGSVLNSFLVDGVAFKKTFSYAGFEQQPKKFETPKVVLLNLELELKSEKENAEIRIENPDDYQSIVDAEWDIIYGKLDAIARTGAQVVLSKLPIGDLATQYFADRNMFCAGRVAQEDLLRVAKATGGQILTTVSEVAESSLGKVGCFEELQVGAERYNIFKDCPHSKTATIILRGGAEQYIEEAERSLNDAIMVVRRAIKNAAVVAGGGAIEMELSRIIREYSRTISGKHQLVVNSFARALEVIPKTLAENAGFDAVEILNKLRQKHATAGNEGRWFGVDVAKGSVMDTFENSIWEPSLVKINAISAACEAACLVLSVDETVKAAKSEQEVTQAEQALRGRGRGGRRFRK
jgi:T-complex protein 1 subunit eta